MRGCALASALVVGIVFSAAADAAFPGQNGLIAFATEKGEIFTVRPDGSRLRELTGNSVEDAGPAWSPNGKQIAFFRSLPGDNTEVYRMQADGTGIRRLTRHADEDDDPAWSPDGSHLVFFERHADSASAASP